MHRERFAFDPASNIVDAKPAEREEKTAFERRQENSLPPQVPKVMGNLLKQYAGMHFVYDARGNLIEKQSPAGQQRYEWDAFNRLKAATVKETSRHSEARYFYDPLGRRIAKEVNGERTVFGWDGDTLAYETNSDSSTHYVYEAGSFVPLAQFVTASVTGIETPVWKPTDRYLPEEDPLQRVPQRTAEARVFYYHCDQIGTPLMMTDDVGDVVWEASYKAWGEARKVIERASKAAGITPRNPIRFQGQQHDEETGLSYNRYRYYDPSPGRFVSQDPIKLLGGINVWQYAPNPVQYIDPLGLARGKCVVCWYNHVGGETGHYTVKTVGPSGSMHTEQQTSGDETWISKVNPVTAVEPVNSATFDMPDVDAAQRFQRDKVRQGKAESDGPYDVGNNSCMTHVTDVLNAGGVEAPRTGHRAWGFLTKMGLGPRAR